MVVTESGCFNYGSIIREALLADGVNVAEFIRLSEIVHNIRIIQESLRKLKDRGRSMLIFL